MKEKESRKKLVGKLDKVFSKYIRLFYADENGFCTCFTCGKKLHRKKITCGHWITRAVLHLRRCVDNVRPQCMFPCNHKAMGNGEQQIFRINLVKEIGKSRVEDLEGSLLHYKQSPTLFKVYTYEIKEWIEKYQSKIDEIFAKNPSLKG